MQPIRPSGVRTAWASARRRSVRPSRSTVRSRSQIGSSMARRLADQFAQLGAADRERVERAVDERLYIRRVAAEEPGGGRVHLADQAVAVDGDHALDHALEDLVGELLDVVGLASRREVSTPLPDEGQGGDDQDGGDRQPGARPPGDLTLHRDDFRRWRRGR